MLLTTPNPNVNSDKELFQILSIKPRKAFKDESKAPVEFQVTPTAGKALGIEEVVIS